MTHCGTAPFHRPIKTPGSGSICEFDFSALQFGQCFIVLRNRRLTVILNERVGQPARDRHTEGRRQRRCHIMPWRASRWHDSRRIYQYDLIWRIDSVSFIASVIPTNFAFTTTVWSRLSVFTFMTIAVLGCTSRESTRRARILFERPREIY
jgi:hypothetical protein